MTLGFFSPVKVDYFLLGCVTTVTHAECQPAPVQVMFKISGYKPSDQSDQSALLENDITIHKRSSGVQNVGHDMRERVKRCMFKYKEIQINKANSE